MVDAPVWFVALDADNEFAARKAQIGAAGHPLVITFPQVALFL
jgi:hypothetical protein